MKPKRKDPNGRTIDPLKEFSARLLCGADPNRDLRVEVIDVLRSIDFDHGRLKDLIDEEEYRTMIKVRDVAMKMLQENPTIFDEVAQIGVQMSYAAKAWKKAVKDGLPTMAKCALRAVACGASFFWSNIPEDKEEERAAILKKREEYFANFRKAIQIGKKIDDLEKRIARTHKQIEEVMQVHREFAEEVTELLTADGGWERLVRVYRSLDDLSHLSFDDMDFAMKLREDVSRERHLMRLRGQCSEDRQELASQQEKLAALDLALCETPDQNSGSLTEEAAALIKRVQDDLTRTLADWSAKEAEWEYEPLDRLVCVLEEYKK